MLVLPNALKIHIAHNKVTKFINCLGRRLKVTAETLGELNSFTFETRVKQLRLNHVHKLFYELCLAYLKKLCWSKRCASILHMAKLLELLSPALPRLG